MNTPSAPPIVYTITCRTIPKTDVCDMVLYFKDTRDNRMLKTWIRLLAYPNGPPSRRIEATRQQLAAFADYCGIPWQDFSTTIRRIHDGEWYV